jgi:photosystem II stability/assembly factor-like uncharacterized protein
MEDYIMKTKILNTAILLTFYFLLFTSVSYAQWELQYPVPTDKDLEDVYFVDDMNGWVVGENGVIIHTNDGGISWDFQESGTSFRLRSVVFTDSQTGWIVGGETAGYIILHTSDGGNNWFEQDSDSTACLKSVFFIDFSKGWAVGENGTILYTDNGGMAWISQWFGSQYIDFNEVFFIDSMNGWITSESGLYKTTNGGLNWNEHISGEFESVFFLDQNEGWASSYVWGYMSKSGILLHTNDAFNTWDTLPQNNKDEFFSSGFYSIYFKNPGNGWMLNYECYSGGWVGGCSFGLITTADGGDSWENIDLPASKGLNALCFTPEGKGCLVGSHGIVLSTTNWEDQWNLNSQGNYLWFYSIDFSDNTNGWAVGCEGVNSYWGDYGSTIAHTSDGGTTWVEQNSNISGPVQSVSFANSNTGWAVGNSHLRDSSYVINTTNGGEEWLIQRWDTGYLLNEICFLDESNGWAVGVHYGYNGYNEGRILKTGDGGNTWEQQDCDTCHGLNSVFFVDSDNGWVVGNSIYNTTDGGQNWTEQFYDTCGFTLESVFFTDTENGWAVGYKSSGHGIILHSTDGGSNWSFELFNKTLYSVHFTDKENGLISSSGGIILLTKDGGVSWEQIDSGTDNSLYSIFYTSDGYGYAAGAWGTIVHSDTLISFGQIIHVPADYPTIQAGIDAANNGDTVLVEQGTYYENINFLGKAITVASLFINERDSSNIYNTIINGSQPTNPDIGTVVTFDSNTDTTSCLYGFTITGGTGTLVPYFFPNKTGGGIAFFDAGGKLMSNIISNNECILDTLDGGVYGGGIASGPHGTDHLIVIRENIIQDNLVWTKGANSALNMGWAEGGGMQLAYNTIVEGNLIESNICQSNNGISVGGAIRICADPEFMTYQILVEVRNNLIRNNESKSETYGAFAGGISCSAGNTIIENNTITGNSIESQNYCRGAGLYFDLINSYYAKVNNNFISGNTSINGSSNGGAIGLYQSIDIEICNNVIETNSADNGGAFSINASEPDLISNNTILNNTASLEGGALYIYGDSEVEILNSILRNDSANSVPDEIYIQSGSILSIQYSNIMGDWAGTGNIDTDPLFADPSNGDFHLTWANYPIPDETKSPCIDAGDPSSPYEPDGTIADMGAFYFNQSQFTQEISLSMGYSFVSSHIIPENPDMTVVMADVINDKLDFVRNSQGQTLRKIGPNWVNGIGDWIVEEGYLVKMFANDSLTINGTLVDPATPIPVVTGFQFVSYFPETPMDALIAFETIIGDDLDFIRNSEGTMLRKIGPNWVNGIGDCQPGEGYLVKMFAEGEIIYPASAKSSGKITSIPTHFAFEGGNAAEPVYSIYVSGLEIGDEVAAFDGDLIVGAMKVNSQNTFENELAVFSTVFSGQGYQPGNPIILKTFDNLTQSIVETEYTLENVFGEAYMQKTYPLEDGLFSVINIIKALGSLSEETLTVYPNPASDLLNINSNNQILNIKFLNYTGQIVTDNKFHSKEVIINTSVFNSGIYFIQIETEKGISTKKVVIE